MTLTEHRARARQYLGGNIFSSRWMLTLLVLVLIGILTSICASVVPVLGSLLVAGSLSVGFACFLLPLARSRDAAPSVERVFDGFTKGFVENLLLGIMTYVFTFLWSLLFIIPGIVKSYAYSMAYYIRADHPEYTWKQCLDESIRITNGHKMQLFLLDLSFIGWILVGYIACGIGLLWVMPYMQAARTSYYESIRGGVAFETTAEAPASEEPTAE